MRRYLPARVAVIRARTTPDVPGYTTRYDPEADCYRAEREEGLPVGAILAGALVRLHARSPLVLKQECAHNEFTYQRWATWRGVPSMSTPFCLGCGQPVRLNADRKWATEDGGTECTGGGGHRVEQVVPDPSSRSIDT